MIEQTHEAVWQSIEDRYFNRGALKFFVSDTGLGKTTGFRSAIKKMWDKYWQGIPVLIMVPTRKDADTMWQEMEAIEPGCSAVWTAVHDPSENISSGTFTPSAKFTKKQASKFKCLIVTHNAGRKCEEWCGRRDLVIVDEYPSPIEVNIVEPYHFVQARDAEARAGPYADLFAKAVEWAERDREKGLSPVAPPPWAFTMSSVSPQTKQGEKIKRLGEAILDGRAFETRAATASWTYYKFDLPLQDRTLIFSATAMYEGWQFSTHHLAKNGPRVDYSQMVCHFKPWPDGVPKYHDKIMSNRADRETFFEYVKDWIGFATEKTLIVCPKPFESDIKHLFPSAKVTHYGCDVGSNEYRECERVFLVSEHHKPRDAHRGHYLGHSGVETVTDQDLAPIANTKSGVYRQVVEDAYAVHLKQMLARGTCRNVDEDGLAQAMEAHCMIDEGRFSRLIPDLFPGCRLAFPDGHKPNLGAKQQSPIMTTTKLLGLLPTLEEDWIGASDLQEMGVKIKGDDKKRQIRNKSEVFNSLGWTYVEGKAGRYGQEAGFRRL